MSSESTHPVPSIAEGAPPGASGAPGVLGAIAELEDRLAQLRLAHEDLGRREESVKAQRETAERFLNEASEKSAKVDERAAELERQSAASAAEAAQARELAGAAQAEAQELRVKAAALIEAHSAAAAELERSNAALESLRSEMGVLRSEAEKARNESEQIRQDAERQMAALREEARGASEAAIRSAGERDEALAAVQRLTHSVAMETGELLRMRETLAVRERELASGQRGAAPSPELEAEIAKRDRAIEVLQARLEEAEKTINEPRDPVPSEPADAALDAARARLERHRRRLTQYRQAIQSRMRKLVVAKEALDKRHAECEMILAQRAKLAAAVETVRAREKVLVSRKAGTSAAAWICSAAVTLGVVGALSWGIVGQVMPATYAVKAIVEADSRGRTMSDEDLSSWQDYHEKLVKDPRLMQIAAERFAQRGMTKLATAPDLQERVNRTMSAQSDRKGSLVIELRGEGADRTERELETYLSAYISTSNESRESRGDPATTIVTQPPKSLPTPVADQRLMFALGGTGAGAVLSALSALVLWKVLVRSKQKYDAESRRAVLGLDAPLE